MKKLTKKQKVIDYINKNGSITSWEAFKELGVTRLSAIIFNLKKEDYKIKTEKVKLTDAYGDPMIFAKYSWEE